MFAHHCKILNEFYLIKISNSINNKKQNIIFKTLSWNIIIVLELKPNHDAICNLLKLIINTNAILMKFLLRHSLTIHNNIITHFD